MLADAYRKRVGQNEQHGEDRRSQHESYIGRSIVEVGPGCSERHGECRQNPDIDSQVGLTQVSPPAEPVYQSSYSRTKRRLSTSSRFILPTAGAPLHYTTPFLPIDPLTFYTRSGTAYQPRVRPFTTLPPPLLVSLGS